MTLTNEQKRRMKRLFHLADVADDFEEINMELMNDFCKLREDYRLSGLLLLIREYVRQTNT